LLYINCFTTINIYVLVHRKPLHFNYVEYATIPRLGIRVRVRQLDQQALPFLHQSSTLSRHQTVRSLHPKTHWFLPVLTPISNKTSGNHSYASETHDRYSANYRLAQETGGYFLGAMPPQQFLGMFLPIGHDIAECLNSMGEFRAQRNRLICMLHLYEGSVVSAPTVLY
jgi:hypothetical protein